jgi:hypothetical protein
MELYKDKGSNPTGLTGLPLVLLVLMLGLLTGAPIISPTSSSSFSASFDERHVEDIELDITPLVEQWLFFR